MNLHRRPGRLLAVSTALILGTTLVACGTETDSQVADASDSTSPSPTSTTPTSPTATASPAGSPLTVAALETGPAPKIAYAVGDRLVLPHGDGFALPDGTFDLARLGEFTVVMESGQSDSQPVSVLDADGEVVKTDRAVGGGLAVNAEGDVIAWMGSGDRPMVLDRGGSRIVAMPEVQGGRSVTDISGRVDCQEGGAGEVSGCTVLVNTDSGEHRAWVSTSHGFADWAGPFEHVGSFLPGRGGMFGLTEITDSGSCSALWTGGGQQPEWETCDWTLQSPSPDGHTILAGSAYADGLGDGQLAFLDADGQLVQAWTHGGATVVGRPQWEDSKHVLAVVFEDESWSIVRFGVDGSTEYAVPPQAGSDLDNPFLLQTT